MIFLHKILPVLLSPLFIVMALGAWGAWVRSRALVASALILLYALSTPIVANQLIRVVEYPHRPVLATDVTPAEAIVVLSGMLHNIEGPGGQVSHEWGDPDRFFGGLELLRLEKAPRLVWTGGRLPWDTHPFSEGELLMQEAIKLGFPRERFLLTSNVQNTAEEAAAAAEVLGANKAIILVTSAFHMNRSKAMFEAQGFFVHPYAVDFRTKAERLKPQDFLPYGFDLYRSSIACRELVARTFYWLKRLVLA